MGEKFKPHKDVVQFPYENVYPKGHADLDNQRPNNWILL